MSAEGYYMQKVPRIHRIYCAVSIASVPLGIGFIVAGILIFLNTEGQAISAIAGVIVSVGSILAVAIPISAFFLFRLKLIMYDRRPHVVKRGTSKQQYFLSTLERTTNVYSVNEETIDAPIHAVPISTMQGIDNPAMTGPKQVMTSFSKSQTTTNSSVRFSPEFPPSPASTKNSQLYENIHEDERENFDAVTMSREKTLRNKSSLFPNVSDSSNLAEASSKF